MTDFARETPRIIVTAVILALFGYGVAFHWGTGIEETLKNVTLLAVGFWLGSSKGATDSGVRTEKALDIAATAQAANSDTTGAGQAADKVAGAAVDAAQEVKGETP